MLNKKSAQISAQKSTQKALNGKSTQKNAHRSTQKSYIAQGSAQNSVLTPKKGFQKIWFSSQTSTLKKVLKKALQKVFKIKSAKKVFRKALWLKNGLKKIIFSQKKAQQSFFGQRSSHKRECSKKYSKWTNSLEIYIRFVERDK